MITKSASAIRKTVAHGLWRGVVTHFTPPLSSPALDNINTSLTQRKRHRDPTHSILNRPDSAPTHSSHTFTTLTSSAPETVLVCQSRISKLSTRSRKRMKIPARSSRVSKTTSTFVFNVSLLLTDRMVPLLVRPSHAKRLHRPTSQFHFTRHNTLVQ